MQLKTEDLKKVMMNIDKEELANLVLELGGIRGPVGYEQEAGEYVYKWLEERGFEPKRQYVAGDRFNVMAVLKGTGGGKSLAFNSHLDTTIYFKGEPQALIESEDGYNSWRNGDELYGIGVLNDRGPMAVWLIAANAIKKSGIKLKGDIVLTAVMGEIGMAQVDEFQGPKYISKGIGTRHAVAQGHPVDYALVAETTNLGMAWAECGVLYIKLVVKGESVYAPRLQYPKRVEDHSNAIIKMQKIVEAISDWAPEYEENNADKYECGEIRPKVNIGAIRGGLPPRPSQTASLCSLYIDMRVPPKLKPKEALDQLNNMLSKVNIPYEYEVFMSRNGYFANGIEPLAGSVSKSFYEVFQKDIPATVKPEVTSMWRDINIYNEVGIPSLTFGPSRFKSESGSGKYLSASELEKVAKVYALTAIDICV